MADVSFKAGDRIKTKVGYPRTHCRTPLYLRGKPGVIERHLGNFGNPELLAYGKYKEPKQPLYLVRFAQPDLWPEYAGPKTDTLTAEIYEHWLERA